jgi:lysophospholipase L1-like esterase
MYQAGRDCPARYEARVREIEALARAEGPGAVILTGSSFFERWKSSSKDLDPLRTVNIGIGGTKIGDHLAHFDRMVRPFEPRALVVYAGSNDISGIPFFSKDADTVVERVREYIRLVHERLPGVPVFYVAITETPSRSRVRPEIQRANSMLAGASAVDGFTFIDTAPALLTPQGNIDSSLFGPDRLHFNGRGYERFARRVRAALHSGLKPDQP